MKPSNELANELAHELLEVASASKLDRASICYALTLALAGMIKDGCSTQSCLMQGIGTATSSLVILTGPVE